jgi:hypothetical protein
VESNLVDALSSGDGVPGDERQRPQEPLVAGAKQMPSDGEEVANDTVDGEEPLGLRHGFEAPHVCLTTARGLMRDFGPVVGIARHVMDDGRHDDTMRGAVAAEAIGDDATWHPAMPFQELAKESRSSVAIPAGLEHDVDDVTVLIHRTPQILTPAVDRHEQLVQMPRVADWPSVTAEPSRVGEAEGLTPVPDGFV